MFHGMDVSHPMKLQIIVEKSIYIINLMLIQFRQEAFIMRKSKDIKVIVHSPKPENVDKFENVLSTELVRLIEALLKSPNPPAIPTEPPAAS